MKNKIIFCNNNKCSCQQMMEIIFLRTLPQRRDLLRRGILLMQALEGKETLDDETLSFVDDIHKEACAVLDIARARLIAGLERAKVQLAAREERSKAQLAARLANESGREAVEVFAFLKKVADIAAVSEVRNVQQESTAESLVSCQKDWHNPPDSAETVALRCGEVTAFYTTPPGLPAASIAKAPSYSFSSLSLPKTSSKAASRQRTSSSLHSFAMTDGYVGQTSSSGTQPQADAHRDAAKVHGRRPGACQAEPEQNGSARAEKDCQECSEIRPLLQAGSPCPYSSICREMRKYL